jgi:hypothetical protein
VASRWACLPPGHERGRQQAGVGSFADHAPFHLGQGTEDVERHATDRCGGVDRFGEAADSHPLLLEVGEQIDQVARRPSEPVQSPNHDRVAGTKLNDQIVEGRPTRIGSRRLVGENALAARSTQSSELQRLVLIGSRDSGVAEGRSQRVVALLIELLRSAKLIVR